MATCRYLKGEKLDLSTAAKRRALVGKRVEYLRDSDIDKSGRGYFFPRVGTIEQAVGRQLCFLHDDWIMSADIVEMREITKEVAETA